MKVTEHHVAVAESAIYRNSDGYLAAVKRLNAEGGVDGDEPEFIATQVDRRQAAMIYTAPLTLGSGITAPVDITLLGVPKIVVVGSVSHRGAQTELYLTPEETRAQAYVMLALADAAEGRWGS